MSWLLLALPVVALAGDAPDEGADTAEPPATSGRLLDDLLIDDGTYSLHRLQMLTWTTLVGAWFVYQAGTRCCLASTRPCWASWGSAPWPASA